MGSPLFLSMPQYVTTIGKREYTCKTCGGRFHEWASQRYGRASYCSSKCYFVSMKGRTPHNKGRKIVVSKPCLSCGKPITGIPSTVVRRKFCSYACFGVSVTGVRHPAWRGGGTGRSFNSREYREWRIAVLARDSGRCRWCDSEGVKTFARLEVHHIVPASIDADSLFDVGNSITLCHRHHCKTRGREHEYAEFLASLINEPLRMAPAPNRRDRWPIDTNEQTLCFLYEGMRLSSFEIARMHRCTPPAILKWLGRFSIPRRSAKEAAANRSRKRRLLRMGRFTDAL